MKKPKPDEIVEKFRALETTYGGRNDNIAVYERWFAGKHWSEPTETKDANEFNLVFNYCRAVVLKYAAMLGRIPKLRVNVATEDIKLRLSANRREKFLQALWEDLAPQWTKVEMNASKHCFGVLQVLWAPDPDQPQQVVVGTGGDKETTTRYTENPFKFRNIPPEQFYAVYRTYDEPDDFLYCIRFDPKRLVEDLKEKYDVLVQAVDLQEGTAGTCDLIEYWDDKHYVLLAQTQVDITDKRGETHTEDGQVVVLKEFDHKYGRPPFFVLQNLINPDEDPLENGSLGDIDSIMGLNQHYNLMVSEGAEEIITNIHRPVVYKTDDPQQEPSALEFKSGAVYPIGTEEELETLQWTGMPQAVMEHLATTIEGIQDLSFIGQAGFGQYPTGATGVSLRLVMQSLEQILQLKIPIRVRVLKDVCRFLLRIVEDRTKGKGVTAAAGAEGSASEPSKPTPLQFWIQDALGRFGQLTLTADDINRNYFADIDYGNILPRAETEYQQNEVYKLKTGAQSLLTTLDNLGVESPEDEVERIKQEMQDPVLNPEKVLLTIQAKQLLQQLSQPQPEPGAELAAGSQVGAGTAPGAVPGGRALGGPAQPGTRPIQPGPSRPGAPPVPAMPGQGMPTVGAGAPYMGRGFGPNLNEMPGKPPGPGINTGQRR